MKLFEVRTTEHNGEQEYWGSHLVAAGYRPGQKAGQKIF